MLNISIDFFPRRKPPAEAGRRASWEIQAVRLSLFGRAIATTRLGFVNARSEEEALDKARRKWPGETGRLSARPTR